MLIIQVLHVYNDAIVSARHMDFRTRPSRSWDLGLWTFPIPALSPAGLVLARTVDHVHHALNAQDGQDYGGEHAAPVCQ